MKCVKYHHRQLNEIFKFVKEKVCVNNISIMCEITDKKSWDIFLNDLSNLQKTFFEIQNALDTLIYEIDYELTRQENSGVHFF